MPQESNIATTANTATAAAAAVAFRSAKIIEGAQRNQFADLLDRAKEAAVTAAHWHHQTPTKVTKPSNWSSMSEKEKTNWRYKN